MPVVGDDLPSMMQAIRDAAAACELLVTIGSVSAGDFDLIPKAVRKLGGEVLFHKVAVKPGKPVLLSKLVDGWLLGLPGNPVSAVFGYHIWVKRIVARLTATDLRIEKTTGRLAADIPLKGDRLLILGVRLEESDGKVLVHPSVRQDSGRLSSIRGIDGFIYADPSEGILHKGQTVEVERL